MRAVKLLERKEDFVTAETEDIYKVQAQIRSILAPGPAEG